VKRYYPEGDVIRFQPANSNMRPIIVRKDDFKSVDIIGVSWAFIASSDDR